MLQVKEQKLPKLLGAKLSIEMKLQIIKEKKKVREEKAIERNHNLDTYVSSGDLGNRVPTVHERRYS